MELADDNKQAEADSLMLCVTRIKTLELIAYDTECALQSEFEMIISEQYIQNKKHIRKFAQSYTINIMNKLQ